MATRYFFERVACPDGKARRVTVSRRALRQLGEDLAVGNVARMPARLQANGLTVHGALVFEYRDDSGAWRFEGPSAAFMPREGRAMAAQILADVAARCMLAPRPLAECRPAHDAAIRRAARLIGFRMGGMRP